MAGMPILSLVTFLPLVGVLIILFINDDSEIDVAALLESFDRLPTGDLVTVESDDANVRVWIE